jgi:hypothetical protein
MTEKAPAPCIEERYFAAHERCLLLLDSIRNAMHSELLAPPCNDDDPPIEDGHAEKTENIERMLQSTLAFVKGTRP